MQKCDPVLNSYYVEKMLNQIGACEMYFVLNNIRSFLIFFLLNIYVFDREPYLANNLRYLNVYKILYFEIGSYYRVR